MQLTITGIIANKICNKKQRKKNIEVAFDRWSNVCLGSYSWNHRYEQITSSACHSRQNAKRICGFFFWCQEGRAYLLFVTNNVSTECSKNGKECNN